MHSDSFVLDSDHLMGKFDEFLDQRKRGASTIVKDHVQVIDAKSGEVGWRVEFGVETHDEANVA